MADSYILLTSHALQKLRSKNTFPTVAVIAKICRYNFFFLQNQRTPSHTDLPAAGRSADAADLLSVMQRNGFSCVRYHVAEQRLSTRGTRKHRKGYVKLRKKQFVINSE
jgi:hypothetical protein